MLNISLRPPAVASMDRIATCRAGYERIASAYNHNQVYHLIVENNCIGPQTERTKCMLAVHGIYVRNTEAMPGFCISVASMSRYFSIC